MCGLSSWKRLRLGKTWPETVVQLLRGDDGKKRGATAGHCSPWRQAQDKSCSRGLVMTWFLPRPWPAFHGQLGPGVGLFIRLGVGYARVVWDVRGWYGMYSRLEFSGYVRKYALCRRGMVAGRSPPYLRLRFHKKSLASKEIRPERRGVVAGRSLPYLRFRARKRNNVDDVHETPRFQNIANTLVFLMFPVTPCKRSTSPRD